MALEHDYFGVLDENTTGDVIWSDTIEVADQSVEVSLRTEKSTLAGTALLDAAAELFLRFEDRDIQARENLVSELNSGTSVLVQYLDGLLAELGEELIDSLSYSSGDIQIDILRSLQLRRVEIDLGADSSDEAFSQFRYFFELDDSDRDLAVSFDLDFHLVEIEVK